MSLETTLRSHPGSIHWHVVKPGLRGGLEITLLENGGTGWIAIHDNRVGHWTEAEIPGLMAALEA